jgi:hypothetical protein
MGIWEFHDKIDAYDIPSIFGDGEGVQFSEMSVLLHLHSKAHITGLAILPYIS